MSWVLIYIATKFLAPIPCISLRIADFLFKFPPKSTNFSRSIPNRLKLVCTPEIVGLNHKIWSRKSASRLKPACPCRSTPPSGCLASPSTPPHRPPRPRPLRLALAPYYTARTPPCSAPHAIPRSPFSTHKPGRRRSALVHLPAPGPHAPPCQPRVPHRRARTTAQTCHSRSNVSSSLSQCAPALSSSPA
jgi:hypothetical protein